MLPSSAKRKLVIPRISLLVNYLGDNLMVRIETLRGYPISHKLSVTIQLTDDVNYDSLTKSKIINKCTCCMGSGMDIPPCTEILWLYRDD